MGNEEKLTEMRREVIASTITALAVGAITASVSSEEWFLTAFVLTLYGLLLLLFHRLYNLLNWVDPTVMFVVSYATFIGIVGIMASAHYDVILSLSTLVSLVVGLVAFFAGAIAGDIIFGTGGHIKLKRSVRVTPIRHSGELIWAWIFSIVGMTILLYYYHRIGIIPLLSEGAENVRVEAKVGQGYLVIFAYAFLTIGIMNVVALASMGSAHSVLLAGFVSGLAALLMVGVGYRGPALKILLDACIVYAFLKKQRLPFMWLLVAGLSIVVTVGLLGYLRLQSTWITSLSMIFQLGIWRIFVSNLYVLNLVFDLFPASEPFMVGRSYIIDIFTLMPGHQPHFGFWLKDRLGLQFAGGGVTQTIVGELYLNWGWIGIGSGLFILGILFRCLYRILTKDQPLSSSRLVLTVLLSTSLMAIVSSGVILVLLFDTLPLIAVFAAYRLCVQLTRAMLQPNRAFVRSVSVKS